MSSQQQPDIVLKRNSTRIVDEFHVAINQNRPTPAVRIDPDAAHMHVESDLDPGANLAIDAPSNEDLAVLDGRADHGELRLRDRGNASGDAVKIEASWGEGRPLVVRNDALEPTTVFTTSQSGGGISVNDAQATRTARVSSEVIFDEESAGGLLEVHDEGGVVTGRLEGRTGALVLDPNDSGGDVVLQRVPTDDPDEFDISVHATADSNSDYGVSQDRRPLIFLDGPDATAALGRQKDPSRVAHEGPNERGEGADGRVVLNYQDTEPSLNAGVQRLLEAGIGWPQGQQMASSNIRCGELVFRTARRGSEDAGTITSCGDEGLTIRTGEGDPALRVGVEGEISTAQPIMRDALPLGPLDIVPSVVQGIPGDVITIDVDVGNLSELQVRVGDRVDGAYELTATVTNIQSGTITLEFDTAAAGDPSTATLSVQGTAQVESGSVSETSLSDDLAPRSYDVHASYATVEDVATMRIEEVQPPVFDSEEVAVDQGDIAEFTINVGQPSELTLYVGELDGYYGLEAHFSGISGTNLEVVFDTAAAGDPSTDTVFASSDNDVVTTESVTETDLDGDLAGGEYVVTAETVGGDRHMLLYVEEEVTI